MSRCTHATESATRGSYRRCVHPVKDHGLCTNHLRRWKAEQRAQAAVWLRQIDADGVEAFDAMAPNNVHVRTLGHAAVQARATGADLIETYVELLPVEKQADKERRDAIEAADRAAYREYLRTQR